MNKEIQQASLGLVRRTVLDDLGSPSRNLFCRLSDLSNEASVESFFLSRLFTDLGYMDSQIATKHSLDSLAVGRGSRSEKYKPDFALISQGIPRCVIDAKGTTEPLDDWVEQCSGYCLALNRKFEKENPVRFFMLSNGLQTILYEWDKDEPLLILSFQDFIWGNSKFEHLKSTVGANTIVTSPAKPLASSPSDFEFIRPTTSRARQLFVNCHNSIWKSEGYGPGPAFMAFVKLMFVKLWADRNIRNNEATKHLFEGNPNEVTLPRNVVTFSTEWISQREAEGITNPINDMFIRLRNEIETEIEFRKKKRIFEKDEELGLRPDTVLDVVRRLQNVDLFGIDEDLNGRLFETFLNATMRGPALGQFFTPRSVVKMMTQLANIRVTRERQDKIIDGCCGSGGFLIEALTEMRNKIRANESLSHSEKQGLIDKTANECLYGIDFGQDPPLARIARINMYLHGDGGSRIYYADGLDKAIDSTTIADGELVHDLEEMRRNVKPEKFDVVLTNPPFSMDKESKNPSEHRVLAQYETARRGASSSKLRNSLRSSIMFIERYHGLLRNGGHLLTVIDDTLLSSSNFSFVRGYIRSRFLIRAIISLPGDTFRRSGSRVKTSVLVLEKKRSEDETQPNWYHYFSEHLGVDDLVAKASEQDVRKAREKAEEETDLIVAGYRNYLNGDISPNVLGPECVSDRLDLRNCVPLFGRMAEQWESQGIETKKLQDVVAVASETISPADTPDELFQLLKVSYEGRCEVDNEKLGREIVPDSMQVVREGQMVFSKVRATDGAIGIVPPGLDGALVSTTSYTVFECESVEEAAFLWSILRSHEIRADMQSLSPGSSRYTTHWPSVGQLILPWLPTQERSEIGSNLIQLWASERELELRRQDAMSHVHHLGVESEESQRRWKVSKAPQ